MTKRKFFDEIDIDIGKRYHFIGSRCYDQKADFSPLISKIAVNIKQNNLFAVDGVIFECFTVTTVVTHTYQNNPKVK